MNFRERADALKAAKMESGEARPRTATVTRLDTAPASIPEDVWALMQDNGRRATELLHELLHSTRFHRLKAGDQAKLIALAQTRAYGSPDAVARERISRRSGAVDVTAQHLSDLATRASLPEYRRHAAESAAGAEPADAELSPDPETEDGG